MNKSELIRVMADKAGITIKDASNAYDGLISAITEVLNDGDTVQLSGFGTFSLKKKPARDGINPATGKEIKVPATKTPVFKFGKAYKDSFN